MTVYFFYGKENFLIEKQIKKLKKDNLDDTFSSLNYRVYDAPNFEDLIEICLSMPVMFGNIVSVIKCEKYFFRVKNKIIEFSDNQISLLEDALRKVSQGHILIFSCTIPREDTKKIDTRKKLFKILNENANTKAFEQFKSYDNQLVTQIQTMAADIGLSMEGKICKELIKKLGVNLSLINSELEKLLVGIYPETKITMKAINTFCTTTDDVFALSDCVIDNDKNKIAENLENSFEKHHPLEIIAILHSNISKCIYVKLNEKKLSQKEIAQNLKMHEYPLQLLSQRISKRTAEDFIDLKQRLIDTEYKTKKGQVTNPEIALEEVLLV